MIRMSFAKILSPMLIGVVREKSVRTAVPDH